MVLKRLTITLNQDERDALTRLCQVDLRPPKETVRFLLRAEAERRGVSPLPASTPRPAGAEVRP